MLGFSCSCYNAERYGGDRFADGAVSMLFGAVGVQLLGSETAATMLFGAVGAQLLRTRLRRRICRRCCYHAIWSCWCSCWGASLRRRICWGAAARERDCGDESADGAVAMLFGAVGVQLLRSETAEMNLRTVLLPCYLELLLGRSCSIARLRRRICGQCCSHILFGAVGGQLLGSATAERICRRC